MFESFIPIAAWRQCHKCDEIVTFVTNVTKSNNPHAIGEKSKLSQSLFIRMLDFLSCEIGCLLSSTESSSQ